jgi:hypothetical protein
MSNVNAVGAPVVEATTLNEELDTLLVQASLFRHSNQQILGRNGRQRRGLRSLLTLHLCNSCQVNNVNCRCAPVSECILHQQHSTILNMQSLPFPCSLTCTSCPYERSSLTPCSRGLVCCFQKPHSEKGLVRGQFSGISKIQRSFPKYLWSIIHWSQGLFYLSYVLAQQQFKDTS